MKRLYIVIISVLVAICPLSSWSDQNNPELDDLFFRLHETDNLRNAQNISREIWKHWYQNDNPDIEALMEQGEISMRRAEYGDAAQIYTQVIKMDPGFAEGWNRRATVYYLMGEYQLSTSDVRETLLREPRHYGALSGQGMIYLHLQNHDLAIEYFKRALDANPHMQNVQHSVEQLEKMRAAEVI